MWSIILIGVCRHVKPESVDFLQCFEIARTLFQYRQLVNTWIRDGCYRHNNEQQYSFSSTNTQTGSSTIREHIIPCPAHVICGWLLRPYDTGKYKLIYI